MDGRHADVERVNSGPLRHATTANERGGESRRVRCQIEQHDLAKSGNSKVGGTRVACRRLIYYELRDE